MVEPAEPSQHPIPPRSGDEPFHLSGKALPFSLVDLWRWSGSDILNNAMRGILAEFLVARALGAKEPTRVEWDAVDVVTPEGIRVEVKSAAWIQSWHQSAPSRISFGIAPTRAWDPASNRFEVERRRQAEVYVFCLLDNRDRSTVDPLNVDQWRFFVLPTKVLDRHRAYQKTLSLGSLLRLEPAEAAYQQLAAAVREAAH